MSIVVSALAVFKLVDNLAVFRLFTDLILNSNRLQTQTVTLGQKSPTFCKALYCKLAVVILILMRVKRRPVVIYNSNAM